MRTYMVYLTLDWCIVNTEVEAPEGTDEDTLEALAIKEIKRQLDETAALKEVADS